MQSVVFKYIYIFFVIKKEEMFYGRVCVCVCGEHAQTHERTCLTNEIEHNCQKVVFLIKPDSWPINGMEEHWFCMHIHVSYLYNMGICCGNVVVLQSPILRIDTL